MRLRARGLCNLEIAHMRYAIPRLPAQSRDYGMATTLDVDDSWITMDNPWIHCISELLGWLPHWMSMIHGYIVFPNYWDGYHIGCR